jgi:hypothetical protein
VPVIEGLESAEDWSTYHQAMLSCLAPVVMLEETLTPTIVQLDPALLNMATDRLKAVQQTCPNGLLNRLLYRL